MEAWKKTPKQKRENGNSQNDSEGKSQLKKQPTPIISVKLTATLPIIPKSGINFYVQQGNTWPAFVKQYNIIQNKSEKLEA